MKSHVHASRKADSWALRFAKVIASVARFQDRRGVLTCGVPHIGRDHESSFVDVAGLALEPKVRFRAWVDGSDAPGIVATRELAARPTMYTVSFWFHAEQQRPIQRVRRSAQRYYHSAGNHPLLDARPPVFESEDGQKVLALGEEFGVPATGRAPNPLAVVDVAFFLIQVGRLHAGLAPLAPTVAGYTRSSPGKLVAIPDREHVISRFLCPRCGKKLWSVEAVCESCGWDLHIRRVRPVASPYEYEYDGN